MNLNYCSEPVPYSEMRMVITGCCGDPMIRSSHSTQAVWVQISALSLTMNLNYCSEPVPYSEMRMVITGCCGDPMIRSSHSTQPRVAHGGI